VGKPFAARVASRVLGAGAVYGVAGGAVVVAGTGEVGGTGVVGGADGAVVTDVVGEGLGSGVSDVEVPDVVVPAGADGLVGCLDGSGPVWVDGSLGESVDVDLAARTPGIGAGLVVAGGFFGSGGAARSLARPPEPTRNATVVSAARPCRRKYDTHSSTAER
jgi:hypothetical protein